MAYKLLRVRIDGDTYAIQQTKWVGSWNWNWFDWLESILAYLISYHIHVETHIHTHYHKELRYWFCNFFSPWDTYLVIVAFQFPRYIFGFHFFPKVSLSLLKQELLKVRHGNKSKRKPTRCYSIINDKFGL